MYNMHNDLQIPKTNPSDGDIYHPLVPNSNCTLPHQQDGAR